MFPHQLTNAYYRKDRMREAEHQRLIDFVTCCTQAPLFRRLSDGVRRMSLWLRGAAAPQTTCAGCAA